MENETEKDSKFLEYVSALEELVNMISKIRGQKAEIIIQEKRVDVSIFIAQGFNPSQNLNITLSPDCNLEYEMQKVKQLLLNNYWLLSILNKDV